ncbi:NAD(P)-binding protein [Coniochaeta sp. PMI_546]|nr:NAD(P)-binding protein [Coniochaeta sp. PMI_546]
MAQKLIVVIGATGGQGGAVVAAFLKDPQWKIRGITRNPGSEKAKALTAKGVEMVKADLMDLSSLEQAFQGANVIFGVTDYYEHFFAKGKEKAMEAEYTQGKNMAKAASKVPTLEQFLWSTLPHSSVITKGEAIVPHFEGKARVDEFIKQDETLLQKTTFCFFTTFTYNMTHYAVFKPFYLGAAKKWVQLYPANPNYAYPCLGDHAVNSGVFVHSLVQNKPPGGTYVICSIENHTLESYLALWGKASGFATESNSTKVIQISPETYIDLFGSMGEEQAAQWNFSKYLAEHDLMAVAVARYKKAQEYMTSEAISSLVSVEETFKTTDWKAYGYSN